MSFGGFDDIPPGLQAPTPPVNHVDAAKRAERLVAEVRAADAKGVLGLGRVGEALTIINRDLESVGMQYNAVAGNARLFVLREHRLGKGVVWPHGDLKTVSAFSSLERSYKTLTEAAREITLIWETR